MYLFTRGLSNLNVCFTHGTCQRRTLQVGLPGMGSQEGAGPVPSRDDETRSESVDIKAPPAVPQPPAEPPPEETEEDKAAEAFGRMQRFAHRLTSTLAKAGVALRAREAVAAYDGTFNRLLKPYYCSSYHNSFVPINQMHTHTACHCLLESIHRLERRDDLQWEQVQKPWLETLWGWFDFIFATLQDWVEHGGGKCCECTLTIY